MRYRDLFVVLIKVFACYQLLLALMNWIQVISLYFFDEELAVYLNNGGWMGLLMNLFFLLFLIFRATWIVDLFKLDKGFENPKLEFKNLTTGNIVVIITFFIGASLVIESLVHLLASVFVYLEKGGIRFRSNDLSQLIILLIGMLLIVKKNWIANFFVREKV